MKSRWLNRALALGPYYCLVLNQKDFEKELRKMGVSYEGQHYVDPDCKAQVAYFVSAKGNQACIVGLDESKHEDGIDIASTLVHEAVHIWQHHADYIVERSPGKEQEAYAIGIISENLMRSYVEQRKIND